MSRIALILSLLPSIAAAKGVDRYDREYVTVIGAGGGTFYGDVHYTDDISTCYGGTIAAPDYCVEYDSANGWFQLWTTDSDGAGADGDVWTVTDGTDDVAFTGNISVATFLFHKDIDVGAAILGPSAPTTTSQDNLRFLAFRDGNQAGGEIEVPTCWDAASDLTLKIYWAAESGDPIQLGETVIWNCDYRVVTWGTDTTEGAHPTAVSVLDTYTEAGNPGTDKQTHVSSILIDYDHANHPVFVGDDVVFFCTRDSGGTDTYSGDALTDKFEISLNCTGIPSH